MNNFNRKTTIKTKALQDKYFECVNKYHRSNKYWLRGYFV